MFPARHTPAAGRRQPRLPGCSAREGWAIWAVAPAAEPEQTGQSARTETCSIVEIRVTSPRGPVVRTTPNCPSPMSLPLAANIVDAAALADELARYRVVESSRLTELLAQFGGGEPAALADHLVRRGVLNAFQAERALAGEARLLALGPYRLTGRAGQGTFGPLFTAVHM